MLPYDLVIPPKRMENLSPHKSLYKNVHSSIIHSSQKVETAQLAITDEWMCYILTKENYLATKRQMKYWYMLQHRWTLKKLLWGKDARDKKPHILWLDLYEYQISYSGAGGGGSDC